MEFSIGPLPSPAPLNALALTGRSREHVVQHEAPRFAAHPDAAAAFLAMRQAAAADGMDLEPFSAFRDFAAQTRIWNDKWQGRRTLYDRSGAPLDYAALGEAERVDAILLWSALPGASRHHWGSDIDVVDRSSVPPDYRIRLLPEEFAPGGVFARLHGWIAENAGRFGFFRPYEQDLGGVSPEPWHLSYAAVSVPALEALTVDVWADALRDSEVLGLDCVLPRLPELHRRFIANVTDPQIKFA
jgi:LAS superfamily LD-carboxypeptidase LdcB